MTDIHRNTRRPAPKTRRHRQLSTSGQRQFNWQHISKIEYRTLHGIKPIEEIQIQYDAARSRTGPTLQINRLINDLKRQLADTYRLLHTQTWNNLINRLDIEEDIRKFWKTIKRLKGNDKQKILGLRGSQNNKSYLANDKERLFRDHWTKICSNDDDDNNDFDYDHATQIENNLYDNF